MNSLTGTSAADIEQARRHANSRGLYLLKRPDPLRDQKIFIIPAEDDVESFERIRCPLCHWHPTPSSVWACFGVGTPEPGFNGCGTEWNTFVTRGRCPGCQHQWQWTSCLRCAGWSLHEEWYDEGPTP